MTTWQNMINGFGEPRRALVLGPLIIGVNAVVIWTLEHTDIVAFAIVFVFSNLIVFAVSRLLWRTLSSTHRSAAKTRQGVAAKPSLRIARHIPGLPIK
jgi:hypothetical protein